MNGTNRLARTVAHTVHTAHTAHSTRSAAGTLASALRIDLNYLFAESVIQYVVMLLMPFAIVVAIRDKDFTIGFGYLLAISLVLFACSMMVVTTATIDVQSGYRLRALAPITRRTQVLARYVMGAVMALVAGAQIMLLNLVQSVTMTDWSITANMPTAGWGLLIVLIIVAIWVPLSYRWNSATGLQVSLVVLYFLMLSAFMVWNELPSGFLSGASQVFGTLVSHATLLTVAAVVATAVLYAASYRLSVHIYQRKAW